MSDLGLDSSVLGVRPVEVLCEDRNRWFLQIRLQNEFCIKFAYLLIKRRASNGNRIRRKTVFNKKGC
jgi:hypothetical protein